MAEKHVTRRVNRNHNKETRGNAQKSMLRAKTYLLVTRGGGKPKPQQFYLLCLNLTTYCVNACTTVAPNYLNK